MKRLLTLIAATLVANAVAIVVADVALDKVSLVLSGFIAAVIIYTVVSVVAEPAIRKLADDKAPAVVGVSSLVATLISLIITVLVTSGLEISGLLTWIIASVLVWVISALLRFVIVKAATGEADPN